ncbi:MAG: hypothetical protein U9O78_02670 [Patescibacteria group bacterium]|nr:hypothetical protein [Patescibacteria group bacterium]
MALFFDLFCKIASFLTKQKMGLVTKIGQTRLDTSQVEAIAESVREVGVAVIAGMVVAISLDNNINNFFVLLAFIFGLLLCYINLKLIK